MAVATVSSASVQAMLNTLCTKYPFIKEGAQHYNTPQHDDEIGDYMIGDLVIGDLKRTELVSALCSYIMDLSCTDQTVPPQMMYNHTILAGLLSTELLSALQHLWQTYEFFDQTRLHFYRDGNAYDNRWDVLCKNSSPLDMIFILRWLTNREMTRAFGTNDPNDRLKSRDGKFRDRCVPENCTYRVGGRSMATLEYTDHCREILEAQRIFVKYIPTLTTRRDEKADGLKVDGLNLDFFVDAAKIAGRMRAQYKQTQQAQRQQQTSTTTNTQSRPRRRVDVNTPSTPRTTSTSGAPVTMDTSTSRQTTTTNAFSALPVEE
jgi:hypothetical protein